MIGKCYKSHRATEFLDFLKRIDAQVPNGLDVHIIMDNYKLPIKRRRSRHGWRADRTIMRISRQHPPPWINQVERWFAELTSKKLLRGVHTSTSQLEADILSFIERHNENPQAL